MKKDRKIICNIIRAEAISKNKQVIIEAQETVAKKYDCIDYVPSERYGEVADIIMTNFHVT